MRLLLVVFTLCALTGYCQKNNYYFGNLHAHTAFSDGNKDSTSSGINKPSGSYAYAKLSDDFDFLGISEHNHYSTNHNPGFKKEFYAQGLSMADAANEEGKFLTMFGMEYGVSSSNNGHVIIYGFNQLIGWESSIPGSSTPNYDVYNPKNDYAALFKKIRNNPNSFCYLAHPFWTDFTLDGTDSTALAFAPYNSQFDSAIVGVPLRSGNAFSSFTNYSDYSTGNYFDYYKKLLHSGYHIGIGYDHDNHYSNFGRGNGGRLVIIAPQLTRANFYKAMKQMNFYGSDDQNAKIEFNLNGAIMGTILSGTDFPNISLIHNDPDGEKADTIRVWRGYKNSGGLWAKIVNMTLGNNSVAFVDRDIEAGREYFYFADIRQKDNQWIVTSPIWYTGNGALNANEQTIEEVFTLYPNPVSKELNLGFSANGLRDVAISNSLGTTVIEETIDGMSAIIDLSGISSGVYIVRVESNGRVTNKKIVVD